MRWRTPAGQPRMKVRDRLADARALKAEVESSKNRGTYTDAARARVLFKDYAETWATSRDWKASTRRGWPTVLKRLEEAGLGGLRLCDIDREAVEGVRAKLAATFGRGTVEGTMHKAMAVLRYAVATGGSLALIGQPGATGGRAPVPP